MAANLGVAFQIADQVRGDVEQKSKLTWEAFVSRVFELDSELLKKGTRPSARPMEIADIINTDAGHAFFMAAGYRDPVSDAVHALLREVYGQRALGVGPIHVGVIMLRDAFIPFYVPSIYGELRIDPWKFVDRSPANVGALTALTPDDTARATDQIIDVWDFGWMARDLSFGDNHPSRLLRQARDQIESACMTLHGSFSQRIALQGAAYAVELAAKSLLALEGWSEERLRGLGHDLSSASAAVASSYSAIDGDVTP